MMTEKNVLKRIAGYTIDQTILIVAIIAILITLVIATVGWDLINRTGGAKLAAQMRQLEDSTGQFFAQHSVWPHLSMSGALTQAHLVEALTGDLTAPAAFLTMVDPAKISNYIPGFEHTGANVLHGFGAGGNILGKVGVPDALFNLGNNTSTYIVYQMEGMPIAEVIEADDAIDGGDGWNTGRIFWAADGTSCTGAGVTGAIAAMGAEPTSSIVNVCYAANVIQ